MYKTSKILVGLATALFTIPANAAFVITVDPIPVEVSTGSPTGNVNIVATNVGPINDDLVFFTVTFSYLGGSPDITLDPPPTISHFGSPFVGGGGVAPGGSVTIGSFSFTMSGAVSPTTLAPISTDFGGTLFAQALSSPAVIPSPLTARVVGVPEPSSALLLFSAAGLALIRRRRA